MTVTVPGAGRSPSEDYDDRARWLDDRDGGWRWEDWAACRDADPALFFPVEYRQERRTVVRDGVTVEEVVNVPTDEEPALAPPQAREICQRCPVAGRCLEKNMEQEFGVFAGTTGYERQLLTKKIVRKRCVRCSSTDLVKSTNQRQEVCLSCGLSWEII